MAREQVEPIDERARNLIQAALDGRPDLNQSKLADIVGVHRSTISKILGEQPSATPSTLLGIANALDIPREDLLVQFQLDFEIDDRFAEMAQNSLRDELDRLRADVGRIRAIRVTGTVGVHFHGVTPEERVFERVFAVSIPRGPAASEPLAS